MNQTHRKSPLKVANAQAFWGDRNDAASDLLAQAPDLDYLTLDYLAEVSLSILAQQQVREPGAGYPKDFLELFKTLIPYWKSGGRCKLITNAGGLNPAACATACAQLLAQNGGPQLKIAVVAGDSVLEQLQDTGHPDAHTTFRHLESGDTLDRVRPRLVTANAYLGAAPLVQALEQGADIVITGRVADPSLTVAACIYHFGWAADDWGRIAASTVAGHLIECGVQVTGGISTDWLSLPDAANLGFPIIEMEQDGSFVVTKPIGSGGSVNLNTVREQLVYEIGDPGRYLSPDLTVSFLGLQLEQVGPDRVRVIGAKGSPPTPTYKVSATFRDGFRAAALLTIFGRNAEEKAMRCGKIVFERMAAAGYAWRDQLVECIGAGACSGGRGINSYDLKEVGFRITIEAEDREPVDHFTRQIMPLVTSGPQGTTGYAEGRPRVHPIFRYWPCLIDRTKVTPTVSLIDWSTISATAATSESKTVSQPSPSSPLATPIKKVEQPRNAATSTTSNSTIPSSNNQTRHNRVLGDIAFARSGDKGTSANIGVIARENADYSRLINWLTADRVAEYLSPIGIQRVERFEMPNLHGMNFLVSGVLSRGLRCDAQGKALGQVLLEMPLPESEFKEEGNE